jgi:AcrR family transcriptional regulator
MERRYRLHTRRFTIPDIAGTCGTRERLMMAGEYLMGQRGLTTVPLEEIARHAQQRNKYAVQYHFSSREGLAQAILDTRFQQIELRRAALRDEIDTTDIHALFTALIYPIAEQMDDGGNHSFARFLLQFVTREEPIPQIMHPITVSQKDSPTVQLFALACRAIGIGESDLYRRLQLFLPVPLRLLSEQKAAPDQSPIPEELPRLITMITAALAAKTD